MEDTKKQSTNQSKSRIVAKRGAGGGYYDSLLWRVMDSMVANEGNGFLLGVAGCGRKTGASTVAANLAIRAADHEIGPILLVDANLHQPKAHRLLKTNNKIGLANLLVDQNDMTECIQPTAVSGLDVLTFGTKKMANAAAFNLQVVDQMLKELQSEYALVIFDLPEALQLRFTLLIAKQLDTTLLVVRSMSSRKRQTQEALRQLEASGVHVSGAVVTDQKNYLPSWLKRKL